MDVHINLDDDLVTRIDERIGAMRRSAFISATVRKALADEQRWEDIEAEFGALACTEHEWDEDPAGWVARGRMNDSARIG